MTTPTLSEEESVHLVRNALLVAGQEMGAEGDHWPVIKATIHAILRDWEEVKVTRNVDAELKTHLYAQLAIMEKEIPHCAPEVQADVAAKVKEIRAIYDAYFTSAGMPATFTDEAAIPLHIQRTKTILNTLEEEDETH